MTSTEAIEHAKALSQFCKDWGDSCKGCPFSRRLSLYDNYVCKLVYYSDEPDSWELEDEIK